jgi:hypothetical protein
MSPDEIREHLAAMEERLERAECLLPILPAGQYSAMRQEADEIRAAIERVRQALEETQTVN